MSGYNSYVFIVVPDHSRIKPSTLVSSVSFHARFQCDSFGDTKWLYKGGVLPDNAIIKGWKDIYMHIFKISLGNVGYYNCYGLYEHSKNHFIANARLRVYGK